MWRRCDTRHASLEPQRSASPPQVEIQLEQKGDSDGSFAQLFNLLFSLGGLATPLAGYLMDVHGFHASFGGCVACLVISCGVNLTTGLEAQVVVFVAVPSPSP